MKSNSQFDPRFSSRNIVPLGFLGALLSVAGCVSVPTTQSGRLTSYEGLSPSNDTQTQSQVSVNKAAVLAASTARIEPTVFLNDVGTDLSDQDRALVANRIDRALCLGLSRRLTVVEGNAPADLVVRSTITGLRKTNRIAAAGSVAVGFVNVIPFVNPRVPIGMGSLSVESEAVDTQGQQKAAMVWSRSAQALSTGGGATVSQVGDAYQLASVFGGQFSNLVVDGESPIGKTKMQLPFGNMRAAPKACEVFGAGGGVAGAITDNFGLPPGWTDRGAKRPTPAEPAPQSPPTP